MAQQHNSAGGREPGVPDVSSPVKFMLAAGAYSWHPLTRHTCFDLYLHSTYLMRAKIDALDQWCLRMLLGIKWYQFVRNDEVRRSTKQPKLTAIIQARRLTLFGHIMRMDDKADAKRILLASPPTNWRRPRPRITWLSTVQRDLKQHHLTLPEAADLALSTYDATQS